MARMHPWYWLGYNLSKLIARTCFRFRVINKDRIPESGSCILAMNHQSFLDPPLAGICCRRAIFFLARKSLLQWPLLGPIFPKLNVIPVDRGGKDMSALRAVIRVVASGNCTVVFPEGSRSLDGSLRPAQAGLGLVIAKTMAPVIPMRVFGAFDAFPRGAKVPRFRQITVVVGEPMTFSPADVEGDPREVYLRLSEKVMERIAALELPR